MDADIDTTIEARVARVARVEQEFRGRQSKLIIRFAIAELVLLAAAITVVLIAFQPAERYHFGIACAVVVVPAGIAMAILVTRLARQRAEAVAAAYSETRI